MDIPTSKISPKHDIGLYQTIHEDYTNAYVLIDIPSSKISPKHDIQLPYHSWRLYQCICSYGYSFFQNFTKIQTVFLYQVTLSLSHPSLGDFYVFSSFPPPRPRPPPPLPPQLLLLLTSKQFELHLRYLGQRKYRSGKMYWMTFWWPWPKVTAVTLIDTNLLVCRIKWEPLTQSLQSLVVISQWSCWSSD